ncbi:unnamed protein product, partial [Laminaria digitata]
TTHPFRDGATIGRGRGYYGIQSVVVYARSLLVERALSVCLLLVQGAQKYIFAPCRGSTVEPEGEDVIMDVIMGAGRIYAERDEYMPHCQNENRARLSSYCTSLTACNHHLPLTCLLRITR